MKQYMVLPFCLRRYEKSFQPSKQDVELHKEVADDAKTITERLHASVSDGALTEHYCEVICRAMTSIAEPIMRNNGAAPRGT